MTDTRLATAPASTRVEMNERRSYIDWPAIIAGTLITIATSLLLLGFGTALGLSVVSPWPGQGAGASSVGWSAAIWFALVQLFSYSIGAYLTGRMRPRAGDAVKGEVEFRDATNGLVVWALGITLSAMLAASAVTSAAQTATRAAGSALGAAAGAGAQVAAGTMNNTNSSGAQSNPLAATVDTMFRSDRVEGRSPDELRAETARVLGNAVLQGGNLSAEDRTYLARVTAAQTGVSQQDAEARVDKALEGAKAVADKTRAAADAARKATAFGGFWVAFVLFLSGMAAVWSATLGGEHRDEGVVWQPRAGVAVPRARS
jgi:hypothetical protein